MCYGCKHITTVKKEELNNLEMFDFPRLVKIKPYDYNKNIAVYFYQSKNSNKASDCFNNCPWCGRKL